jgi:hypothetical protein
MARCLAASGSDAKVPVKFSCLTSINYLSSVTALQEGDCDDKEADAGAPLQMCCGRFT